MSLTCGLCDQQIDPDDTAFHVAEGCKAAQVVLAVLTHDIERNGPISHAIERIIENALGRNGRLGYLLRLAARSDKCCTAVKAEDIPAICSMTPNGMIRSLKP